MDSPKDLKTGEKKKPEPSSVLDLVCYRFREFHSRGAYKYVVGVNSGIVNPSILGSMVVGKEAVTTMYINNTIAFTGVVTCLPPAVHGTYRGVRVNLPAYAAIAGQHRLTTANNPIDPPINSRIDLAYLPEVSISKARASS